MKTKPSTCHSLEGPRLHTSQNQKCAPARSNKVRRSLPQKNYQNTQNNAPKRYAHTVGNRCDSAKCCVAAVYTYKYNINTILSRAIQQRYSQFEGLGKKGRITWPHGGTHLQNEAGAFHAPSVQPDPDPLQKYKEQRTGVGVVGVTIKILSSGRQGPTKTAWKLILLSLHFYSTIAIYRAYIRFCLHLI